MRWLRLLLLLLLLPPNATLSCCNIWHLAVQLLQQSLLVIPNVLHLLQHSRTKHNFVARISFLEFLLCRQQQEQQQRQQQSRARVTKNANICSQSCQPSAEYTVAPRRTQMKLAQMTLYANIFKISLLLGYFLLLPHCTLLLQ